MNFDDTDLGPLRKAFRRGVLSGGGRVPSVVGSAQGISVTGGLLDEPLSRVEEKNVVTM